MRLSELETKFAQVNTDMTAMLDERDRSGQEFTDEQSTRFKALAAEKHSLAETISTEKEAESHRKQTVLNKANQPTPEEKAQKQFSWVDAVKAVATGRANGLVAEMSQEADKELKARGIFDGVQGVGIPSWMVNIKGSNVVGQTRDLTSGGTATGAEYVQTLEIGHQFGLEIAPKAFGLGVEVLTGLTGNVYITETGEATAEWEGENDANAETTPATSKPVNLSPKRLGAFADISKTLLIQAAVAETRLRNQLGKAMSRKLDWTIFQGTGVAPMPYGVVNTANVNTIAGATPNRQYFLDMWALIANDNADIDTLAIATTADIKAFLMGAYLDAGSGRFLMEDDKVIGYNTIFSNNMPANTIIMGVWNQMVVGNWGGLDLVINPFTRAKENILEIVVNAHYDIGCYRPASFCVAEDVTIS